MASPRERMLRLLSLLQTGRQWSADELTAAMQTTDRTLRRDMENLRELGYPVRGVRGPGGYYRLDAGKALPPLMLDDDEAIATVLGLRLAAAGGMGILFPAEAAARAESKLRRILPVGLRQKTDDMLAVVDIENTEQPQPTPDQLATIAEAIAGRKELSFDHVGAKGLLRRRVEPARLVHMNRRWYLYAWDLERADWRAFRLDRIAGAPIVGLGFEPRVLPTEDVIGQLNDQFNGPAKHRIVLTLHATVQEAASRLYRVDGSLDPLADGRCRYVAHVDSFQWLALVLVVTDMEFDIEEPEQFRDYIRAVGERFGRS